MQFIFIEKKTRNSGGGGGGGGCGGGGGLEAELQKAGPNSSGG